MGWHGSPANVDSGAIKDNIREFRKKFKQRNKNKSESRFVKEFTRVYEKQEQAKDGTYAAYEDKSGGHSLAEVDDIFSPPLASTPKQQPIKESKMVSDIRTFFCGF